MKTSTPLKIIVTKRTDKTNKRLANKTAKIRTNNNVLISYFTMCYWAPLVAMLCSMNAVWLTVSSVRRTRYRTTFMNLRKRIVVALLFMSTRCPKWSSPATPFASNNCNYFISILFTFFGATIRRLLSSFKCWSDMPNVCSQIMAPF